MPQIHEDTLEQAKAKYLSRFVATRLKDITDLAMNKNMDAVALLVFAVERLMGGAEADEAGVLDYWQNLRRVEDALMAGGQTA
jgi:hypothetical protein